MKKYLFILILFLLPLTTFSQELKKVTLQLSWFDQFQFAGYYIAKEKGFYEDFGLDVEIKPYEFGINVSKEVDEKRADFGIGRETLILERVSGKKIVALYSLFQATPLVLLTTKDSKINTIEDFKNKKIMTTADDSSEVSIKAMIHSKKIKLDDLSFIKHSHDLNDLINKKVDIISAYISKSPFELEKKDIPYTIFDPKDYGFDMYSDFLFTHEDMIKNDIDTVLALKKASLKAWEYAYSNLEETVDLLYSKYNSQYISKEALMFEAIELKKLSYSNVEKLGDIKANKIQRIYDLYNVMGLISNPINLNSFIFYKNDDKIFLTQKEKEYLNTNKEKSICSIPDAKPYSYIENNEVKGVIADYFKEIELRTKINFKLVKTDSISQTIEYFKDKKCDIITSLSPIKERKSFANFTKPYINVPLVLISKMNFPFIDSLDSLENKKIGLIKNYSSSKIIKQRYTQLKFVDIKNLDEAIEKIQNNEIDGHVDLLYKSIHYLYEEGTPSLKISNKLDISIPVSIAVQKENEELLNILNKTIDDIGDKGRDNILNKWIAIDYKETTDYKTFWQILFIIFLLFIALLYKQQLLKRMNKSLNEKVKNKTDELIKINASLEYKIEEEVSKNINKDKLLERQAKMAAMGEMIENIAHQWRQPLSVITTGATGIKLKKELNLLEDKFLIENLDSIINSSVYLSHTIDDFRFFFKPNKEKEQFCLERCLEKTLNILSSKFDNKKIKIIKDIDDIEILGHETELIQVFINLLNNSKDALENITNGKKLIFISVKKIKDNIVIKIQDNAGGIDSLIIEKIFEPYFTTKHKSQGTGIGLYMCDQIISKHMNGTLEVSNASFVYKNKKYKGAEFTIVLYKISDI